MRFIAGVLMAFAVVVFYSIFVSGSLRSQARNIAADSPYCLQVSKGGDYVPVAGFFDTLGLFMRGHGGYHHAVLIVNSAKAVETFHWSYFKGKFVSGSYGPFPIVCVAENNYLGHPAVPKGSGNMIFSLNEKWLSIPLVYSPRPDWPGDAFGYSFLAAPPDFLPTKKFCSNSVCNIISISMNGKNIIDHRLEVSHKGREVTRIGDAYGLQLSQVIMPSGDKSIEYVQRNESGSAVTYIECPDEKNVQCRHVFYHDYLVFSFFQPRSEVVRWKEVQKNLVSLNDSFITSSEALLR